MTKISSLTELLGASVDQANDLLPIVDMSETGAARNKKIKITQLLGLITDIAGLLDLKGSTDCSANPNYPAASKGDTYLVSVAGKIGGASGKVVELGDLFIALADNAGGTEAAVGTSWTVIQGNIVGGATITELDDIPDVNAPTPAAGNVLTWDDTPGEWVAQAPSGITSFALGDATDVDTTGQASGDLLIFDGAEWIAHGFCGAMVHKAADQTTADYTTLTTVAWDSEASGYDTDGFHDNVTNNSRLTVPDLSGTYGMRAAKVSIECNMSLSAFTAADWVSLRINKNGSPAVGLPFIRAEQGSTTGGMIVNAENIPVLGDGTEYFEVQMQVESDTSITVNANRSAFKIWVTEWQS